MLGEVLGAGGPHGARRGPQGWGSAVGVVLGAGPAWCVLQHGCKALMALQH